MYGWILWIALLDNPNQGTFSSLETCKQVSQINYQMLAKSNKSSYADNIMASSICIKIKKGKR